MNEITKCEGKNCPLKKSCKRYVTPANPYRQAYLTEVPFKESEQGIECHLFLALEGKA